MEYKKQFEKIDKIINEIPYEEVHIHIKTKTENYMYDKVKETKVIGFKVGDSL